MKPMILCTLIILLAGPAYAEDYLPLETGNFWSYVSDEGLYDMRVVLDPVPLLDGNPYPIEYIISTNNQGLVNYWTSEPDGGVLLWGFWRETWGIAYDPPIRMVDAPLFVGKAWNNTVESYSLPDLVPYMTFDFNYTVSEDPVLTVPAGEFPTFGIGEPDPEGKRLLDGRFTLCGELITDKTVVVDNWWSLGVGIVQENLGGLMKLETYTDHPVAVEVSSWGEVKALYR